MSQLLSNSQLAGRKCYRHSKTRFTLRDFHVGGLEQYMIYRANNIIALSSIGNAFPFVGSTQCS